MYTHTLHTVYYHMQGSELILLNQTGPNTLSQNMWAHTTHHYTDTHYTTPTHTTLYRYTVHYSDTHHTTQTHGTLYRHTLHHTTQTHTTLYRYYTDTHCTTDTLYRHTPHTPKCSNSQDIMGVHCKYNLFRDE